LPECVPVCPCKNFSNLPVGQGVAFTHQAYRVLPLVELRLLGAGYGLVNQAEHPASKPVVVLRLWRRNGVWCLVSGVWCLARVICGFHFKTIMVIFWNRCGFMFLRPAPQFANHSVLVCLVLGYAYFLVAPLVMPAIRFKREEFRQHGLHCFALWLSGSAYQPANLRNVSRKRQLAAVVQTQQARVCHILKPCQV
jgi:hypothetical protein